MMIPPKIHDHLLTLAETVAILIACRMTPDTLRQILVNFTKELKTVLPPDSTRDIESAEARAIIRALAYRRDD